MYLYISGNYENILMLRYWEVKVSENNVPTLYEVVEAQYKSLAR